MQDPITNEITDQQAKKWIKNNNNQILPPPSTKLIQQLQDQIENDNQQRDQNLEKQSQFQNDNYYINFFILRSDNIQIRNRYLSKLDIYNNEENVIHKKIQHIFIFDWDDTILCTSYLSTFQFLQINIDAQTMLKKLDQTAYNLLQQVLKNNDNDVYIITNAAKGWVEYSSKIYLPQTNKLLLNSTIHIISARSQFGQQYPGDFTRWKIQAFKSILNKINKYLLTNLICIGDSNIQIQAAHCLNKELQRSLVKTIKFRESPKPDQLIKQQQLVCGKINEIFNSKKNLTIRLERKQSDKKK